MIDVFAAVLDPEYTDPSWIVRAIVYLMVVRDVAIKKLPDMVRWLYPILTDQRDECNYLLKLYRLLIPKGYREMNFSSTWLQPLIIGKIEWDHQIVTDE